MGFLNPIQKQFIRRPDEAKEQIVFKWPDNNIRMHTQITVEPDEVALFVKEGQVKGVLNEGVHDLNGANIPFIGGLINMATGGNYFVSEIFFISIREFVNQLFGGPLDNLSDQDTGLVLTLRCYGDYSIRVIDPHALILNLTGTTNVSSMESINEWVSSQLLKKIREVTVIHIMDLDTTKRWDILGISSRNDEIEQEAVSQTNLALLSYGLAIVRIGNITINLNDKDAETLKQLKRDTAYGKNMNAADAALKLGAAKGFEDGSGAANIGLLAGGIGFGYAATNNAIQNTMQNERNILFCTQCGVKNDNNAKFCSQCGTKLHE